MIIQPNPANESVTLTFNRLHNKNATLTISNIDGRIKYTSMIKPSDKTVVMHMDLNGFARGVYIVQLKTENQVTSQRLVIQ